MTNALNKRQMPKFFHALCAFQKSNVYIALVGLVALICCILGCEAVAFTIFILFVSLTFLMGNDLQTILPVLFMAVMCIGQKAKPDGTPYVNWYETDLLPMMPYYGVWLGLLVGSIVFYIIYYKPRLPKPNALFWGMVAISASLFLGGIFYQDYNAKSLLFGGIFSLIFVGLYMLLYAGIKEDALDYIAKSVVVTTVVMLCELLFIYVAKWEQFEALYEANKSVKGLIYLGWGIQNNFAPLLLVGLAFTLFYSATRQNGWFWILLSTLVVVGIYFTYCRGCLVLCLPLFAVGVIYALIRNKRGRLGNLVCLGVLCCVAALILIFKWDSVMATLSHYIAKDQSGFNWSDSGRIDIWKTGITQIFTKEPFLGVGFMDRSGTMFPSFTYFYHNTFIQFLVNCGVVGAISYVYHRITTIILFLRKPTEKRFFLGLGLCGIIGYGFIDVTFFIYYFGFFYVAFLVVADKDYQLAIHPELANKRKVPSKPRVLFPCIEAGLGHIMPMRAIADAFELKYGNRCEVVRTSFYKDSADADLMDYEKMLVSQVIRANRYPLFGYGMFAGLRVFGKQGSMDFVIKRISPVAYQKSVQRMAQLNADVVFSTHWTTAYYAKDVSPSPLNVLYCPDADMNAEWDTGADLTMISVQKGVDDAIKYLGLPKNKVQSVSFPIRKEAEKVPLNKAVCRAKIGAPVDKFTVVLADGGYACGRLRECTELLVKSNLPITVIAVCGNNKQMYQDICGFVPSPNVTYMPLGYCEDMLSVVASADCFMGKSGANTVAEFAYFGVPLIITLYSTPIERSIGNYYIKDIKCAVKVNSAKSAVEYVEKLLSDRQLYALMSNNAMFARERYGAEGVADALWNRIQEEIDK